MLEGFLLFGGGVVSGVIIAALLYAANRAKERERIAKLEKSMAEEAHLKGYAEAITNAISIFDSFRQELKRMESVSLQTLMKKERDKLEM